MTKEELLEKGMSSDDADIVISAFNDTVENDTPLLALEKALSGDDEVVEDLFKATDSDDDEEGDDDDYDEEYMKKNMKRYMKENKKSASGTAKEVGLFGDKMEKAISNIDMDSDGAVIEMMDLAPILEEQSAGYATLAKAIIDISNTVNVISSKVNDSYSLMEKAARVQVATAQGMDQFLTTPAGRRGVTSSMNKAIAPRTGGKDIVYSVLEKAMKAGVDDAGLVLSSYESAGKNVNKLNQSQKNFISNLIQENK